MDTSPTDRTSPECRQVLAELFGYLDGEIGDDDRTQVAHHLDRCSDCLEAFEFHHELRDLIAQRCRREVPEQLRERILGALEALDPEPRRR